VRSCNTVTIPSPIKLQGLPDRPLFTFCTAPSASDLSRNLAILTRLCGRVPN
jgi:hypothetical protein